MFKNYVLTSWRHILNNPLFSFINIFGLAIGFTSFILILLFVRGEISHDQQLPDAERIVRLHSAFRPTDSPPFLTVRAAGKMMEAIRDYASEQIESGVRLLQVSPTVGYQDKVFNENVIFADPSFFEVFDLPFAHGSAEQSFNKPMDLIITQQMAKKYFGRTDVVGEVLTVCCIAGQELEVKISGVLQDLPATSHLDIDFLTVLKPAMFDFSPSMLDTWTSVNTYTYFKLKPGFSAADLKERIWYWTDHESPFLEMLEDVGKPTDRIQPNVMAVPDIYLHASQDAGSMGDLRPLGNIIMVYAFSGIALLILIVAAINFMNLSTARASQRAREVALRKVLGATRTQVALQFLGEAITVTLLALLFALVMVEMGLPLYNQAIGRELTFSLANEIPLLLSLLGISLLVGLFSGSYPAIYLSRFLPARILKANQSSDDVGSQNIRGALVVFQFAVSIGLSICTAVIYAQTLYARNMDLGYDVDHKLVLHGISASGTSDQNVMVDKLSRIPGVRSVVLSSEVPSQDNENNNYFQLMDGAREGVAAEKRLLNIYASGFDFFESYDMEIIAGRSFDRERGTDEIVPLTEGEDRIGNASVVINESALHQLGFENPEQALGKVLRTEVYRAGVQDLTIIGVAKDVYYRSLKFGIRASAFLNYPVSMRVATVSFDTDDIPGLVKEVERVWKEVAPMTPISHEFLADMLSAAYQEEEQQAQLFAAFSILAVVIACLGLYGLASFTAERRTREIGIRKVLGARVRDIVQLLVWQFSRPVLLANIIAWPAAWYLISGWLEGFQYRIGTTDILAVCAISGAFSLVIAWSTVASRAVKVARANPIEALRYE